MGVRETARKIGVSHPTVSDMLAGFQPSYATCQKLASAYNIPLTLILQKAQLLELSGQEDERKREINYIYEKLDADGQKELLEQGRLRLRIQEERGGYEPRSKPHPKATQ